MNNLIEQIFFRKFFSESSFEEKKEKNLSIFFVRKFCEKIKYKKKMVKIFQKGEHWNKEKNICKKIEKFKKKKIWQKNSRKKNFEKINLRRKIKENKSLFTSFFIYYSECI